MPKTKKNIIEKPLKKVSKKVVKKSSFKKIISKKTTIKKVKLIKKPKIVKTAKAKKADLTNLTIGIVTHYFPHVNAAVIKLKVPLRVGESIQIKGHTTDLKEIVASMQIDRKPVQEAKKGAEIGLFVASRVRDGDIVYRVKNP